MRETLEGLYRLEKSAPMVGAPIFRTGPGLRAGLNCTAIQSQLNVLDDNPVVAVCETHNLALINRGPLAMGLLMGRHRRDETICRRRAR